MRYSRMQNEKKPGGTGKSGLTVFFSILVVAAVAVYLIGAAKVGDFISNQIVTPVVAWITGEEVDPDNTKNPPGSEPPVKTDGDINQITETIAFPAGNIFALQAGVFSQEDNALSMAKELSNKGGAGYILEDKGSYRVLLAGYKTADEADNVKERLLSEQNMETKRYDIESREVKFSITAESDTVNMVKEAAAKASSYQESLLAISIAFDKGDSDAETTKKEIAALAEEADKIKNDIDEIASSTDNSIISGILSFYNDVSNTLDDLSGDTGDIQLSSGIKHAYLSIGISRMNLSTSFSSST